MSDVERIAQAATMAADQCPQCHGDNDAAWALCQDCVRDLQRQVARRDAAIQAVRDIHKPVTVTSSGGTMPHLVPAQSTQCRRCFSDQWHPFGSYPCPELATIAAELEKP